MILKNNIREIVKDFNEEQNYYSMRKSTMGIASVPIGLSFAGSKPVKIFTSENGSVQIENLLQENLNEKVTEPVISKEVTKINKKTAKKLYAGTISTIEKTVEAEPVQ